MTRRMSELLLIPALLSDDALWRRQAGDLADLARVTIAPPPSEESLAAMAAAILERAPGTFALGGISMGGYICFEILRQAPERVERLALVDTTARPDPPEKRELRQRLVAAAKEKFRLLTRELTEGLLTPEHAADESIAGPAIEMARRVGPEVFAAQQNAIMHRPDSRPLLGEIACPTLVICGKQDITTPPDHAKEMADGIPNATLVLLDDCAHYSPIEQPDDVSEALRAWLES